MGKARTVLALQLLLAAAGLGAVGLGAAIAAGGLSLAPPSLPALLDACQRVLLPEASVAGVASLLLGVLAFAVVGRTLWSAAGQLRASRRVLRALRVVERRTIDGQPVTVIGETRPVAFCAGLLRPRVYVSTGTLATLDDVELGAVIAHERHHARLRDPLRVFLARAIADGLFFLPALRPLGGRYAALAELAADRAAVRASRDDPAPLASALLSFEAADPAVVGIAPERVDHLMGEPAPWQLPAALLAWALVAVSALLVVALRLRAAGAVVELNVPLLVAQSCMVAMAIVPLVVGAAMLVRARTSLGRSPCPRATTLGSDSPARKVRQPR
ncbi:MAG TPA: M56 family metallopeptidase [Solirubrobacteraceae bacterium]|nr:M56 family metallopeptidase [Solirubrobacteraceae bacterium]